MNMPGFSAEAALYEPSRLYGALNTVGLDFEAVKPQQHIPSSAIGAGTTGRRYVAPAGGGVYFPGGYSPV